MDRKDRNIEVDDMVQYFKTQGIAMRVISIELKDVLSEEERESCMEYEKDRECEEVEYMGII